MTKDLNEITALSAIDASKLLRTRAISSRELTEAYLGRIEIADQKIGAYITVCKEEALKQADRADRLLLEGAAPSPLTGIPFSIKDNFCTKGIRTSCASRMLADFLPPYDAFAVEKLKNAGAVMLGKVNMDEFAMGCSTETSKFRKTVNPIDMSRVPGGSSGGSAASVASREAVFSIGSDTGGSIRQPAAFCGNVGFKPTYGRISRYGLIAFSSSLDTVGIISRTVTDSATVLEAISGKDAHDATSVAGASNDFTSDIRKDICGMRIGLISESLRGASADVAENTKKATNTLEKLGATVEEVSIPTAEYALYAYHIIASAEAYSNLARFDGVRFGYRAEGAQSVSEMIRRSRSESFGDEVKRRIILGAYSLSAERYEDFHQKAINVREALKTELELLLSEFDALITPTSPTVAYSSDRSADDVTADYSSDAYTVIASMAQLPAIAVPSGTGEGGMPTSVQIIGGKFEEAKILRISHLLSEELCTE